MPKRSVVYQAQAAKLAVADKRYPIPEAVEILQAMWAVKAEKPYKKGFRPRKGFDQTVELVMFLGIDPKQSDQMIRGSVSLPKGIGKTKRVVAFCPEEMTAEAKAAGAVEAGADEVIKKVNDGWTDFDLAVAHPSVMGKVGKLGRILGPSGKMPSPKSGTVTPHVVQAVKEYSAGSLEYRYD